MRDLFECQSHFEYLKQKLNGRNAHRGIKTQLAEFIRVQPAYLSQVLAGKYSLSLEQADLASQFFDHSKEESDFFLLLVSRDRAGTPSLRAHFERQMSEITAKRMQVVERLGKKEELTDEAKGVYYSSWMYAALHVACTIPTLQSRQALARHFSLPVEIVEQVLHFLELNNLIEKRNDAYVPTPNWVRLDKRSPHIIKHHSNWRQKAIQNLERQSDEDLHYSGVYSIDAATMKQIKDKLLSLIKEQMKNIEQAKEEDLVTLGVDLFRVVPRR